MSPRLARLADAPHIAALEESFPTGRWSLDSWTQEMTSHRAQVLVEGDGESVPLGVAAFSVAGETCDLNRVIVAPAARRGGVALRLLLAGLAWAEEQGATQMMLEVEDGNEPALALYQQIGFVTLARRANYYGPGRDALVMALPLGEQA
ncbi:GNAT family N-acetyltransferase [Propioniciclava flava]